METWSIGGTGAAAARAAKSVMRRLDGFVVVVVVVVVGVGVKGLCPSSLDFVDGYVRVCGDEVEQDG